MVRWVQHRLVVRQAWLLVSFTCSMPRPSNTAGVAWTAAWELNLDPFLHIPGC